MTLEQANAFVDEHHRHHEPVPGCRWRHGLWDLSLNQLCGVAIVGNPVARELDERRIVEVNRCCTDGTPNACSMLYGAAARVAQDLGFFAIITYTLDEEEGASLRADGWWGVRDAVREESWNRPSRPRGALSLGPKTRWVRFLCEYPEDLPERVEDVEPEPPLLALMAGGAR
ncbi:XF1762 family protein [Corallococcus sp. CA054B]|uniref:XF1762 family protein n=1 Tax=Corallococcus sp. CA054B TaxID=2316734 RepID=UPI0018F6A53C|nr:XF1762 family protein [Corallococcus sp. CA054B]